LETDPGGIGLLRCNGCGAGAQQTVTVMASQNRGAPADGADATVERPGAMTLPGFEVLGELGRGGMGVVYRARQLSLNRDVAIKVLPPAVAADPHLLARFRNEAAAAARITDAHVLPVFEVIEHQGTPLLILPLIDGSNLRDIIRDRSDYRNGTRTKGLHPWAYLNDQEYLQQVLPVLDQMIDSVTAIHMAGVIHRDIKSSNVLVDRHGNAWVGDFGLARLRDAALLTQAGHPIGTPAYMSPEQRAGRSDVDERSDLFSLGATLYETLTLELPFGREGVRRDDVPPRFPSVWQRLLSRDYDACPRRLSWTALCATRRRRSCVTTGVACARV
jgi:serine/threonine protein kinase